MSAAGGATHDVAVIGAGIVGLATAKALLARWPRLRVCVLEKDAQIAGQQTSHNSGVIHSGIYYRPGSLKGEFCVRGRDALVRFCEEHEIPYELCGKLIVATRDEELPRLDALAERATANGVQGHELVGPERVREIEPHVRALRALRVPSRASSTSRCWRRPTPGSSARRVARCCSTPPSSPRGSWTGCATCGRATRSARRGCW